MSVKDRPGARSNDDRLRAFFLDGRKEISDEFRIAWEECRKLDEINAAIEELKVIPLEYVEGWDRKKKNLEELEKKRQEIRDWLKKGSDAARSPRSRTDGEAAVDPVSEELARPPSTDTEVDPYRTGAPGRPTARLLVMAEHRQRIEKGVANDILAREAEHLAAWLREIHPNAPPMTTGTIKNVIRRQHNAWKSKRTK